MTTITTDLSALDAALQSARWYSVNRHGQATLCHDERDACATATDCDHVWSLGKPHRPMQLVDAAPVARIVAECRRMADGLDTASRQLGEWAEAMRETVAERDKLAGEVAGLREALKSARSDALEDAAQWYMREFGGNPGTVGHRVAGWRADEIRALPQGCDAARAAIAPPDMIANAVEFMKERAAEQAEKDAEHSAAGRCPDCEGVGMQGGQFYGGYWTCEKCGGSGNAAIAPSADTFRDLGQADEHDEDLGASGAPLGDAFAVPSDGREAP